MASALITTTMGRRKRTYYYNFFLRISLLFVGVAIISTEAKGGTPANKWKLSELLDGDGIGLDPAPDERVFSILSYGAKPDGKKDNLEVILNAKHKIKVRCL